MEQIERQGVVAFLTDLAAELSNGDTGRVDDMLKTASRAVLALKSRPRRSSGGSCHRRPLAQANRRSDDLSAFVDRISRGDVDLHTAFARRRGAQFMSAVLLRETIEEIRQQGVEAYLTDLATELSSAGSGGVGDENVVDAAARPVLAFVDAINRGDVDGAITELAPDALHFGRISNYRPEGVRVLFTLLREVFPDLRLNIRELSVDGNRVTSRIVATGTHTGSFVGKPATGRSVTWQSVDVAEVGEHEGADASYWKILKRFWDLWNDPNLWHEIGFIPAIMC